MTVPLVLCTTWRRRLATWYAPDQDLYTLNPDYADAVATAGGLAILAPEVDADGAATLIATVDAVLLSGGGDIDPGRYGQANAASSAIDPGRDASEVHLLRAAIDRRVPVLGICRGVQLVNVALGGDLHQEVQHPGSAEHPTYEEMGDTKDRHRHDVVLDPGSRLASLYGAERLAVNSLHHQAVDSVADGCRVVATATDGTIEALEVAGADVLAVQWHPELMAGEGGQVLFDDLVARARTAAVGAGAR